MTKLGFMARSPGVNRSAVKRRKTRMSRGSVITRGTLVNVIDKNGNVIRRVAVSSRVGRFSSFGNAQRIAVSASAPKIKEISAESSAELSFRMLNALDDKMKEEGFDVFE